MFKRLLLASLMLLLSAAAPVQKKDPEGDVQNFLNSLSAAWKTHDSKKIASFWLPDGDLIDTWGQWGINRTGVEKIFHAQRRSDLRKSHITITVNDVQWISPDTVFVDSRNDLSNILNKDGKVLPPTHHHCLWMLKKCDGHWKIVSARMFMTEEMPEKIEKTPPPMEDPFLHDPALHEESLPPNINI